MVIETFPKLRIFRVALVIKPRKFDVLFFELLLIYIFLCRWPRDVFCSTGLFTQID